MIHRFLTYLLAAFLLLPLTAFAITCDCYLRSIDGDNGDDCSTWSLAHETLDYSFTQSSPGDVICMDDDHSESFTAGKTFSTVGAVGNPIKIIVVQTDTTTPVTIYGASPNIQSTGSGDYLRMVGYLYFWGISIKAYDGLQFQSAGTTATFENSFIEDILTDSGSSIVITAADTGSLFLIDTVIKNASFVVKAGSQIVWRGGTYESTGIEYNYLIHQGLESGDVLFRGVDLSEWAGSIALIETTLATADHDARDWLLNCKLPSSVTYFSGSFTNQRNDDQFIIEASGNADETYSSQRKYYAGATSNSITKYRTGGSTYDGTNGISIEFVTTASALEATTCIRKRIANWNADATAGANVAINITYDDAIPWDNGDFYLDVMHWDATDQALGKWVRTKPATMATTPDRDSFTDVSSTETWIGTSGFTDPQEETVDLDFTGANGPIEIWGNLCKPSATLYIDMLPEITI